MLRVMLEDIVNLVLSKRLTLGNTKYTRVNLSLFQLPTLPETCTYILSYDSSAAGIEIYIN